MTRRTFAVDKNEQGAWDRFAAAALIWAAAPDGEGNILQGSHTEIAAKIADGLLLERRKRLPRRMLNQIQALEDAANEPAGRAPGEDEPVPGSTDYP